MLEQLELEDDSIGRDPQFGAPDLDDRGAPDVRPNDRLGGGDTLPIDSHIR
jgi:hypothetical protein